MKSRAFPLLFLALCGVWAAQAGLGRGRPGDILYVHHPPDPVNVRTGNFYLPVQDYYLSCFGFPLEVYRSYNSFSARNGPFGKGWTFNYDVQIVVSEKEGLKVVESDGFINEYMPAEAEKGDRKREIAQIAEAKKREDVKYTGRPEGKGEAAYDEYRKQLREDLSFFERQRARYLTGGAKISKSGKYVSRVRGTTFLEKKPGGYVRTSESGRIEEYDPRGLLARVTDRNGNELKFTYNARSLLERVNDGCGQWLALRYNSGGKLTEVADSIGRKLAYAYDDRDRLTSAVGLDGEKTAFRYDNQDRMTAVVFADGASTEIAYDAKTGFATKQTGPGTKVTTYKYGKEGHKTWAQVEDNEGGMNRYEYIDPENKIVTIDKAGKKTVTTVSACCGKPLSIKDEKGVGEEFKYDEKGNLIERIDALKRKTEYKYEPRFNLPSEIRESDGTSLRFVWDKAGNLTFASGSSGQHIKLTYEKHGKIEQMTDHRDNVIVFAYSPFGKPTRIQKKLKEAVVGTIYVTYDRTGEILKVDYEPKDAEVVQEIRNTLAGFLRLLKPTGIDFEI